MRGRGTPKRDAAGGLPRSRQGTGQRIPVTGAGCVALLLLSLLFPASAPAELIDRVLASVNNEVITLSDLRRAAAFNAALGRGPAGDADALEELVNRKLLLQEAARVRFDEVSAQDIADELARLRRRLGTDDAYRDLLVRMNADEVQLAGMVRERLLVEQFLKKKIGIFARATREEAQEYYSGHPGEFQGRPFSDVQKVLQGVLSEQKAGQQFDQFIAELRARADIRMNPLREEGRSAGHGG